MTDSSASHSSSKPDKWRFAGATLLVLGLTSTAAQFVARQAFAPDMPLAAGESGWSTGGLVALVGSIYMAIKCQTWKDFRRRIGVLIGITAALAVAAVYLMDSSSTSRPLEPANPTAIASTEVPVHELDRPDCEAKNYAWTSRGCLESPEAGSIHLADRLRLQKKGWEVLESDIGLESPEGLYWKLFSDRQYNESTDDRCISTACVALIVRTDSITSCFDGLTVEGNIKVGSTIVEFAKGKVKSLPPNSKAELIVRVKDDRDAYWEITKVTCS